jgi:hypothetical protein
MCGNAMLYNDEGSEVYFDAKEMRDMAVGSLKIQLLNGQIVVTDQDRVVGASMVVASPPKKKRQSGPVKKRKVLSDYESDGDESEEAEEEVRGGGGRYDGELPDIGY